MRSIPCRTARQSAPPRRVRRAPSLERLEDRSVPTVAPLPIPGGTPGFHPEDPFEHANLAGPADAPPPFGNEPSSITNFNGFVGVAHFEGTGHDGEGHTLLWDADLRFMQGTYRGVDGKPHFGTFVLI